MVKFEIFNMIWYDGNSNYLLKFGQLVGNKIANGHEMWYDMIKSNDGNSNYLIKFGQLVGNKIANGHEMWYDSPSLLLAYI